MFKVTREEHITKTFRMPEKLVMEMQVLAQNKNVSLNNLVIQCCRYAMEHLDAGSEDGENGEK